MGFSVCCSLFLLLYASLTPKTWLTQALLLLALNWRMMEPLKRDRLGRRDSNDRIWSTCDSLTSRIASAVAGARCFKTFGPVNRAALMRAAHLKSKVVARDWDVDSSSCANGVCWMTSWIRLCSWYFFLWFDFLTAYWAALRAAAVMGRSATCIARAPHWSGARIL